MIDTKNYKLHELIFWYSFVEENFNKLFPHAKLIDCLLLVAASGFQDHGGEIGMVGSVGEVLGFEAEGASTSEGGSMSTGESIGPVVAVELYTGFCSVDFHGSARSGLYNLGGKGQLSRFMLVQNEAMVIACTVFDLFVISVNHVAYWMWFAEIKRCAFNLQDLASWYAVLIYGNVEVCINLADVVHGRWGGVGYAS